MAPFSGKRPDLEGDARHIAVLAQTAFASGGIETTIEFSDDPENPQLFAMDRSRYQLYNVILACRNVPRRRWTNTVNDHVHKMLSSRTDLRPEELDAAALRRMVRTRLVADMHDDAPIDFSYARPFAPGLVTALCIDYPDTVTTIGAEVLTKLALREDELYSIGQTNTNAEPFDEHNAISDGVHLIGGGSLFIASKAADMGNLIRSTIGPAPHGVVFAVPHRNMLLYSIPRNEKAVIQIGQLLRLVARIAFEPGAGLPGGLLSSALYYWQHDVVEVIGGRKPEDGTLFVDALGLFGDTMNALADIPE